MSKRKTGSRLVSLLLAVLMLIAYMPLLGEAAYAETGVPEITTDKAVYTIGEDVKVTTALNDAERGWIGLYRKSDTAPFSGTSVLWYYPADFENPKTLQSIDGKTQTGIQNWGDGSQAEGILQGEYQLVYVPDSHGKPYAPIGEPTYFTVEDTSISYVEMYTDASATHKADTINLGDPIYVRANSAAEDEDRPWIGLYKGALTPETWSTDNKSMLRAYSDVSNGSQTVAYNGNQAVNLLGDGNSQGFDNGYSMSDIEGGTYTIILFKSYNDYGPIAYKQIEIVDPNKKITTDKTEYQLGEAINVTADSEGDKDWVGLFKKSDDLASEPTSFYWYYVKDHKNEAFNILEATEGSPKRTDFGPGDYVVAILENDGYTVIDSTDITIKAKPSTLVADKKKYQMDEPIKVTATSDYPNAWVGFYDIEDPADLENGYYYYYNVKDHQGEEVNIYDMLAGPNTENLKCKGYRVVMFSSGYSVDKIFTFRIEHTFKPVWAWREKDGKWEARVTLTALDDGSTALENSVPEITAETTDSTCSAAGQTIYTASFDVDKAKLEEAGVFFTEGESPFTDTKTVEIPKKEHTPGDTVKENVVEPKCGVAGSHDEVVYCTVCEGEISRTTVEDAALEHDYQEVANTAKAATCTEAGKEADKKCSLCNDVVTGAEIPALGHDYQEVADSAKAATCTEDGKEADQKCSRCEDVIPGAKIPATGHKEETVAAKEATCTEKGLTEGKKCSVCGETLVAQEEIPALGHDYQVVEGTAKAATSKEEGKEADKKCSRCGDVITGAVIPKLEPTEEEKAAEAAKEELNKAVDEAKKVEQGNYTDESFKALQDAIAEAEALAKDENATKEQLDAAAAKIAAAQAALEEKEPEIGTEVKYSSNTYKVTSAPGAATKTVAFTKAKNSKTVTVPSTMKINGETYKVTSVAAKAFKGSKCTTAYIGANVKKLDKYAFRYSKVKTVYIKSKLLSKTRVKGSLKYSKVTTVKAKVSTKKSTNKKYAKKFKSYFTKANAGKKVTVKY